MKTALTILALALICVINAQSVFVVQNDVSSSAHQSLDSALHYAVDGDYIYLPGGSFNVGDVKLTKRVNIIGAGHYPDSTQATGATNFTGNIYFINGSGGSTLQGIYLNGDIFFGDSAHTGNVQNIYISRCNINRIFLTFNESTTTNVGAANVFVKDCVIRSNIRGAYAQNVTFENNIIAGVIGHFDGYASFRNNIFQRYNTSTLNAFGYKNIYYVDNCLFENNIFRQSGSNSSYFSYNSSGNTFNNNVFGTNSCIAPGVCNNCIFSVNFSSEFVNVPDVNNFHYTYNYHLSDTAQSKGAGLNGTDCGIYGGDNPYKEGAVPINPHIQFKNIPSATDSQGRLNIQVRVSAQDN